MPRILAIDYGTKRTGLAVTDPLQIIASALTTISTGEVFDFLRSYLAKEAVELIVVGNPMHPDGNPSQIAHLVKGFARNLQKMFPETPLVLHDERFTSVEARQLLLQSGASQKKRRDKSMIDKISAALILEDYMKSVGKF
jgi:putative Holliday junction resolvase